MLGKQLKLEVGYLVGYVFLCFEQENLGFSNLLNETFAVVLDVPLLESVAMSALSVAVLFGEAERHVASVDVVTTIGLDDWQDSVAADAAEGTSFVGLAVSRADEDGEGIVSLLHLQRFLVVHVVLLC